MTMKLFAASISASVALAATAFAELPRVVTVAIPSPAHMPPMVTDIAPPGGYTTNEVVALLITVLDSAGVTAVKVNDASAAKLNSTQWTYLAPLRPGPNQFRVDAFDAAGNVGHAGVDYFRGGPCLNDPGWPVITKVQPPGGPTTNAAVDMLVTTCDDGGVVNVMVNSNYAIRVAPALWAFHAPLAPGPNNFTIMAVDADGNTAMAHADYLRVPPDGMGKEAPRILGVYPASGMVTNNPLTLYIKAVDGARGKRGVDDISVSVNGNEAQALGSNYYRYTLALAPGTNLVTLIARDATATAATTTVMYVYFTSAAVAAPLVINTTADALTGYLNLPYDKVLDADGGDGTYFWTVNGLEHNLVATPDGEITGIPVVPGQREVVIEVSSAGQTFTTNLLITILEESPGVAIISDKSADGIARQPYAAALTLAGTSNAQAWQFEALSGLPAGLTLQPDGCLSGTPGTPGTYALLIRATHAGASVTKRIPFNVVPEFADTLGALTLEKLTLKIDWTRPRADNATAVLSFTMPRDAAPLQQQWIVKLGNYPVPLENPVSADHGALVTFANHPRDANALAISAKAQIDAQGCVRLTVSVRNAALAGALGVQNQSVRRGAHCLPVTMKIGVRAGHTVQLLRHDGVAGRANYLRTVR